MEAVNQQAMDTHGTGQGEMIGAPVEELTGIDTGNCEMAQQDVTNTPTNQPSNQ